MDEPRIDDATRGTGSLPCPVCRRPVPRPPAEARFRPFCTKRCADLDLHRWLSGSYRIPTDDEPDPGQQDPPAQDE